MVRKIISLCLCFAICAIIGTSQAKAATIYEDGNLSSTYVTYFRDIVSGIGFNDNYVAFRSGQYAYTLVTGDLTYNNGTFTLNDGTAKEYTFTTSSGYNSSFAYEVTSLSSFNLTTNDNLVYSNLGDYPELVSRGEKYEILTSVLLVIFMLSIVIYFMFRPR